MWLQANALINTAKIFHNLLKDLYVAFVTEIIIDIK